MDFARWEPPRSEILQLRGLSRRIQALLVNRAQEKNRRHADEAVESTNPAIRKSIERHIGAIEAEMEILSDAALDLIRVDPQLAQRFTHLTSVKGIATASAITLLAELAVLPDDMTVRQWVAHAGIDPRCSESGTSVRGQVRISKVGNRHLRRALFLPAMVASQHEPQINAYYQQLLERGKKPLQALVAVMRKLLHAIYGMFKNDTDFVGARFYAGKA
jgi:transposase